jgi:ribulose-5-phosphate 4-epimerase/fuculose-1-phosphate aldolase
VPSPSSSCTTTHAALHESLLSILARRAHRVLTNASHAHEPAALRLSTALARVP